MQVQGSVGRHKYHGVFSTIRLIYAEEGVYGCFRGLIPSVITVPLFWSAHARVDLTKGGFGDATHLVNIVSDVCCMDRGIYFTVYNKIKAGLADVYGNGESKSWHHVCAAVVAGGTGDICSNPLWVSGGVNALPISCARAC